MTTEEASIPVDSPGLLLPEEAADLIRVDVETLSNWRSSGKYGLPFIKIGRLIRYERAKLIAWYREFEKVAGNVRVGGEA